MSAEGFKLNVSHTAGCWFEDGKDAFAVHDGVEYNRASNGRLGGSWSWERFLCNDPDCPAVALVRIDKLVTFVSDGVLA